MVLVYNNTSRCSLGVLTAELIVCNGGLVNSHNYFKSRLSLIVRVNVVLNRTVVVDSD